MTTEDTTDPTIKYGPDQKPWSELVPEGATVKAPSEDPTEVYPTVPAENLQGREDFPIIDYKQFEIPPTGMTDGQRFAALASLRDYIETQHRRFTGYQANQKLDYASDLSWLLDIHANNVGDPFQTGIFTLNTKFVERAVLDYFAALWNVDWPHHDDSVAGKRHPERYWGYVLSMGSTEANIYGMFNARDYLKGRALIEDETAENEYVHADPIDASNDSNQYKPIVFYSEDTHYSVVKAMRILEMTTFYEAGNRHYPDDCPPDINGGIWPKQVPSHDLDDDPKSGTIDVNALEKLARVFLKKGHPIVIVLNVGSTWKGAYDDVPAVNAMLHRLRAEYPWLWYRKVNYGKDKNGNDVIDHRRGFWVHVDGALGASYLPYLEMAYRRKDRPEWMKSEPPSFDFRNDTVMSICSSLHKWIGAPWPGGVYLTKTDYQLKPPSTPSYIGAGDTTLGGSRSAFSPVLYWDYLAKHSYDDFIEAVLNAEEVGNHFEQGLHDLERDLKAKFGEEVDLWISRSRLALAVRFRLVNPKITYKFTVDAERISYPVDETHQQDRSFSHIFLMQSLTKELADDLLQALRDASEHSWHGAFPEKDGSEPNPGPIEPTPTKQSPPANYRLGMPHRGRGLGSYIHPAASSPATRRALSEH